MHTDSIFCLIYIIMTGKIPRLSLSRMDFQIRQEDKGEGRSRDGEMPLSN